MEEKFEKLICNFEMIKKKGWIRSSSKSTGAIGITFEKELGLLENNSFYPDYKGVEIKCSSKNTLYPLTLFSLSFDGPGPRELCRIVDLYGYPDKTFKNRNILYARLSCKNSYLINNNYYFKLEIDWNKELIYLVVYDAQNNIIDKKSYISFITIKNRLLTKMNIFAMVYGDCRSENGVFYFKYTDIFLYKLKNFNEFLHLLENDEIVVSIGYRITKSKLHYGKSSSKNIVFAINRNEITNLFNRIN